MARTTLSRQLFVLVGRGGFKKQFRNCSSWVPDPTPLPPFLGVGVGFVCGIPSLIPQQSPGMHPINVEGVLHRQQPVCPTAALWRSGCGIVSAASVSWLGGEDV